MRSLLPLISVACFAVLVGACLTPKALQDGDHAKKLGLAYLSEGNTPEAVTEFKTSVKKNRWDAEAWHGLGMAYFASERHTEAEVALLRALKIEPEFPQAQMNLGSLYLAEARWDEAIEHLNAAASNAEYRQPARARHNLGWAWFNKGDYSQARSEYREVLRRFPLFCPSIRNLGQVDEAEGALEDALARYGQAVDCDPSDLRARLALGIVEARLDLVPDACEHLGTVKTADPFGELRDEADSYLDRLNCANASRL